MKLKVYSSDGSTCTDKNFAVPEFEGKKGLQTLKDLLVIYHGNRRQGTAKAKTRAEVAGSGKKIFRQKGTGNARHGAKRAPIFVGGGVAHGPKVRDWTRRFNKKAKRLAFARAIFDKCTDGEISLIEEFAFESPKTKLFNEVVTKIDPDAKTLLVCDQRFDDNTALSARNIERISLVEAQNINAWHLTRYRKLIITEKGFELMLSRLQKD